MERHHSPEHEHGSRWLGLVFILIGTGWLLRKLHIDILPYWLLSWPMAMFVIGLLISIKTRFRRLPPLIITFIGLGFLLQKYLGLPHDLVYYIWPLLVIMLGMIILFKPKRRGGEGHKYKKGFGEYEENHNSDKLDITAIFCGSKKRVLSKNFQGGEIAAIFGGTELNLTQADFDKEAALDVSIVFGGLKIIIPNNWELKTQLTTIAAGVEDKRGNDGLQVVPEKTLILTGTIVFGGIDIQNH